MLEVFFTFLKLGLFSFGGPVAHLGYFHNEFVLRKKWINENTYADLVALCQFLPGPASSQIGMSIGFLRSGWIGTFLAWLGFTLPSAIIMVLFAFELASFQHTFGTAGIHGLKVVAVSVIALAIYTMANKFCSDLKRFLIAIFSTAFAIFISSILGQIGAIILGGLLGWFFLNKSKTLPHAPLQIQINPVTSTIILTVFFSLLLVLPLLSHHYSNPNLSLFSSFFRTGSLVFGGGHVVLPLLQAEVVSPGWVSNDAFMAGYGAAQAIPGPLFSFAAYIGAISKIGLGGWLGAFLCLFGIFLPSFFLIFGILPFWERLRNCMNMQHILQGVNAAVVGLLAATFYRPILASAIFSLKDFVIAFILFLILFFNKAPSWLVVLLSALVYQFIL